MRTLTLLGIGFAALPAAATAQTRSLAFHDGSGLAAEADVTLQAGGTQLVIRLQNRSSAIPVGFSNSDQILTGLSFDLGLPGQNAGDPKIVSGTAFTGPSSMSVNFDVADVGASADVSGEWGYSNQPTTNTYPNFVSANQSKSIPFGGANLDGPTNLSGPQGGLVATVHLDPGGLGVILDEIVATLDLDQPIADLAFLDNGARVEYGSDAAFLDQCESVPTNVQVNDAFGYNLVDGLKPAAGALPTIGNATFCIEMDDPADLCGMTPGALSYVIVNEAPLIQVVLASFGCGAGTPGVLMIDVTDPMTHCSGPVAWNGPGSPAKHSFVIADTPELCGIVCRGQGFWLDFTGDSRPIVLTNVVEFLIAP